MNTLQLVGIGIGTTELLIIFGICLLIFGATRIPELGKSMGLGIRGFQKAMKDADPSPKQLESEPVDEEAPPRAVAGNRPVAVESEVVDDNSEAHART